ncbi:MAG: MFS transporter [Candidatus Acidiferrales bacterium]|jgi:MFS family permease
MTTIRQEKLDWKKLTALPGFRWLFVGMFVSLFGTGMNYAGVTWYILSRTHSTVSVSWMVILVTLPGLFVPPFGGVLIDRVDRRYLAITLDFARSALVLGIAALAVTHRLELSGIYWMELLLGMGFAIYWSTTNSLVQELIPATQLVGANSAILIAVQGGMIASGAVVGFVYERAGLGGILAIDGATYFVAAICLVAVRHGRFLPHHSFAAAAPLQAPPVESVLDTRGGETLPGASSMFSGRRFTAEIAEGLRYLGEQPRVLALGLTYACMMAGVISANVLVVALARDLLSAGPRGYGYIEAGWAIGAVAGGLVAAWLAQRRPVAVLVGALAILAIGHTMFPLVRWLALAVAMNALFGACRALGGVLTQSSLMGIVPRRLMGRTLSAFSVIATILQMTMSFLLGWFAEHRSLTEAFALLGLLYAMAAFAALRTRTVESPVRSIPFPPPAV